MSVILLGSLPANMVIEGQTRRQYLDTTGTELESRFEAYDRRQGSCRGSMLLQQEMSKLFLLQLYCTCGHVMSANCKSCGKSNHLHERRCMRGQFFLRDFATLDLIDYVGQDILPGGYTLEASV